MAPFTLHDSVYVTLAASVWPRLPPSAPSTEKNDGFTVIVNDVGFRTVLVTDVQVGATLRATRLLLTSQPVTDWPVAALATPPPPATVPNAARLAAASDTATLRKLRMESPPSVLPCDLSNAAPL